MLVLRAGASRGAGGGTRAPAESIRSPARAPPNPHCSSVSPPAPASFPDPPASATARSAAAAASRDARGAPRARAAWPRSPPRSRPRARPPSPAHFESNPRSPAIGASPVEPSAGTPPSRAIPTGIVSSARRSSHLALRHQLHTARGRRRSRSVVERRREKLPVVRRDLARTHRHHLRRRHLPANLDRLPLLGRRTLLLRAQTRCATSISATDKDAASHARETTHETPPVLAVVYPRRRRRRRIDLAADRVLCALHPGVVELVGSSLVDERLPQLVRRLVVLLRLTRRSRLRSGALLVRQILRQREIRQIVAVLPLREPDVVRRRPTARWDRRSRSPW